MHGDVAWFLGSPCCALGCADGGRVDYGHVGSGRAQACDRVESGDGDV